MGGHQLSNEKKPGCLGYIGDWHTTQLYGDYNRDPIFLGFFFRLSFGIFFRISVSGVEAGRKEGSNDGRKEGRKKGRKEGRKEEMKKERKKGRKE